LREFVGNHVVWAMGDRQHNFRWCTNSERAQTNSHSKTMASSCRVVLSLAHLLKQQHVVHANNNVDHYAIEKSALLTASVQCATELASAAIKEVKEAAAAAAVADSNITTTTMITPGEVHLIMTGSPRPTFAETNAWLLEGNQSKQQTTTREKGESMMATDEGGKRPEFLAGSLSILDNDVSFANSAITKDDNDECMNDMDEEEEGNNHLEQLLLSNDTTTTITATMEGEAAIVNTNFMRRHTAPASSSSSTFAGPMVGQAVVNAINQTHGIGLHSNRSKLLQGTIDRPEWIQSRWTDGECVFGELVNLCGLNSFENTSAGGHGCSSSSSSTTSSAEEKKDSSPSSKQLRKTTNLSAHLITVPVILSTTAAAAAAVTSFKGMEEGTIEEIARGVLRCLKRKGSTSVSNIFLIVPPPPLLSSSREEGTTISVLLTKAFAKLEQYNDMIGMPRLMANVCFEVVPVVCNYDDDR